MVIKSCAVNALREKDGRMKKIRILLLAVFILILSVALVACNNDAPNVDAGTGGETGGDTDLYDIAYYSMIVSEFESAEDADAFADQICSQGGADGYSYMFVSGNVVIEADMTYGASAFECLSDMPDVKVYMKSF